MFRNEEQSIHDFVQPDIDPITSLSVQSDSDQQTSSVSQSEVVMQTHSVIQPDSVASYNYVAQTEQPSGSVDQTDLSHIACPVAQLDIGHATCATAQLGPDDSTVGIFSFRQIIPVPKALERSHNARKRKVAHAAIITLSPYKRDLGINLDKKMKTTNSGKPKKRLIDFRTRKNAVKSQKKQDLEIPDRSVAANKESELSQFLNNKLAETQMNADEKRQDTNSEAKLEQLATKRTRKTVCLSKPRKQRTKNAKQGNTGTLVDEIWTCNVCVVIWKS